MKTVTVLAAVLLLAGCGVFGPAQPPRIDVEYQELLTPVSNVPMPPPTDCPKDALITLDSEKAKNDGEVAKAYRISILQLRECSALRQKVLDKYREIATQDAKKIDEITSSVSGDGPFGSGVPTADNAGAPTLKFSPEEQHRQLKIDSQMRNIEGEFDDLATKTYNVGDLDIPTQDVKPSSSVDGPFSSAAPINELSEADKEEERRRKLIDRHLREIEKVLDKYKR